MSSRANEPAYPVPTFQGPNSVEWGTNGMTLREHYAGLAMQGLNANPQWADQSAARRYARAVADADGMLAELAKEQQK